MLASMVTAALSSTFSNFLSLSPQQPKSLATTAVGVGPTSYSPTRTPPIGLKLTSVSLYPLSSIEVHAKKTTLIKSTYNLQVIVEDNEPEERLVSRFRRAVIQAGLIQECKRRRFFENSRDKKKRKVRDAAKRNRKRRYVPKVKVNEEAPRNDNEEDDNWEIPEVAQIIGKPGLAPAAWVRRLVTLCDHAPATPFDVVQVVLEKELGQSIGDLFARFDVDPLGSASIAQVLVMEYMDGIPILNLGDEIAKRGINPTEKVAAAAKQ